MPRTTLIGLVLLVTGAVTAARADEWTKKFALTGKPELRVETDDGNVSVQTGDGQEIEAKVVTVGWRISAEEVRVSDAQTGDRVELKVRIPHRQWNIGVSSPKHRSVRIDLTVPREANLEIYTGDGNVSMDGVKGETRLSTGDGDVDARSLEGALEAKTGDGNLRIRGRFDLLKLETGDGKVEAEVSSGSKMAAGWSMHTGDGDVVLRLPANFAADLDLHTGDGHIDLDDFPITVSGSLRDSAIRGKMNGGGPTLTVHTGDGSIHMKRL